MTNKNHFLPLFTLFVLFSLGFSSDINGQKVHFSQVEMQPNGLYYQVNTIPPFTGVAFDVHPPLDPKEKATAKENYEAFLKTGHVSEEVHFKNGKKHGKALGFDQMGTKIFQAEFIDGKKTGLEEQWYAKTLKTGGKSVKKLEINFENDKPNGIAKEWYQNGNKRSEGQFLTGREEGVHLWWFEEGGKDQEISFKDGLENGTVKNWYPNGNLKLESNYKMGKQHGKTTEYYDNGTKKAEGTFLEGEEDGNMSSWSRKAQILDEKIYENGKLIKAMDYRTAGIRTKNGFTQVFNELSSNYQLNINSKDIKTINTRNIGYFLDGKVLQLVNVPIEAIAPNKPAPAEALKLFKQSEMEQAAKDFGTKPETKEETLTTKAGLPALYWSFEEPVKKGAENQPRRVLEEHFMAVVCQNEILLLSGLVTNNHNATTVKKMLTTTANTIEISTKPIDLNTIRDAAIKK